MSEFNGFCRTCMHQFNNIQAEGIEKCYNIFETTDLAKKLMQCSQLVVSSTDGHPQWLCKYCYNLVLDFSEFQRKCKDSAVVFHQILCNELVGTGDDFKLRNTLKTVKSNKKSKTIRRDYDLNDIVKDHQLIEFSINETMFEDCFKIDDDVLILENDKEKPNRTKNIGNARIILTDHAKCSSDIKNPSKDIRQVEKNYCDLRRRIGISRHIYKCDVNGCGLEYSTQQEINRHLLKEHKCICNVCGNKYNSKESLHEHKLLHVDKSLWPFKCNIGGCFRTFRNAEHYRKHKYKHDSKISKQAEYAIFPKALRPYSCRFCNKEFTSQRYRTVHETVHTGEQPYTCEVCGRGFAQTSALKWHQRTHFIEETNEKLSCPICLRSFKASDLKMHILVHAGEKPYECTVCGIKFRYKNSLSKHHRQSVCSKSKL